MKKKLADWISRKEWTEVDIQKYVGSYQSAHLSYATDEGTRALAASGGTTSALLIDLLEQRLIDGALVCKTVIQDGRVRPKFVIATSPDEVLAARGSKYIETHFLREALPLIEAFDGKLAVVGLPCDITNLSQRMQKDHALNNKVALRIALLCGHNSKAELTDHVTQKLEQQAQSSLTAYQYRIGHWRGQIVAEFENGERIIKPTKYFNDYQNLYFFCERKCLVCHDHFGYSADISVGDVWLFELKSHPVKHTGVIVRSDQGIEAYQQATQSGAVHSTLLDIRTIMDGQSRVAPFHYNVSARAQAGRFFGINIKDTVKEPVRWHSFLNACLTMFNVRLSESPAGKRTIFVVPRPVLRGMLYFKKGLELFK